MLRSALREDWRVTVSIISGGHFVSHFYLLAFPPLFPLLADEFLLTNAELGLIVSIVNLTGLLQTPVGEVVDRTGAKRIFVLGIVVTASGTALASLADSYLVLLGLVAVAGLGQPAFHPTDYAMLDTVTGSDTKGKAYSLHSFAGWLGFAAAPLVIGTLGYSYGWRFALVVAGAVGLAYAAVSTVLLAPHYLREIDDRDGGNEPVEKRPREPLRRTVPELLDSAILVLFVFFLLSVAALQAMQSFVPILATDGFDLPATLGNTALTALPAAAAAGVVLGGILADRYSARRIIGVGLTAATVVLWAGMSDLLPPSGIAFVAVFAVAGFSIGLVNPARDKLVSQYAPPDARGRTFGFVFTGLTVGAILGPVVFGAVIDATSVVFAFLLIGATLVLAAGMALSFGSGLLREPTHSVDSEP